MGDFIVTQNGDQAKNMECTTRCRPIGRGTYNWKQYWISKTENEWPNECIVLNCENEATVGAHVHVNRYPPSDVFIIPMCISHNHCSNEVWMTGWVSTPVSGLLRFPERIQEARHIAMVKARR